jgi:hypothetical protein
VASRSWPAKTVPTCWGRVACFRATFTPGRAMPAAQPQTEFTITSLVPGRFMKASTSAAVRSSSTPAEVRSRRMGSTRAGS